jgi:hypothetical protein
MKPSSTEPAEESPDVYFGSTSLLGKALRRCPAKHSGRLTGGGGSRGKHFFGARRGRRYFKYQQLIASPGRRRGG